ncbi:MAG: sulfotransferase [Pseudomonadales bacterium]|nr:sulfotransferase [Pseudomonadales bacterium]
MTTLLRDALRLHRKGDIAQAGKACRQLIAASPRHIAALELLTQCLVQGNDLPAAITTLDSLIRTNPQEPKYYTKQAELYLRLQQPAPAIDVYQRLLAVHPAIPLLHYHFAKLLYANAQPARAIEEYELALSLGIDQPEEALVCLSNIHTALHQQGKAIELLRRALGINPDYVIALFNLATLTEETGDRPGALELYERVVRLQPTFDQAFARLANLRDFERKDDPLIARMLGNLGSPALGDAARESIHYGLGKALDDCGDYDAAFEHYAKANRLGRARIPAYEPTAQEELVKSIITQCSARWFDQTKVDSDARPIFICGMFRSGTTLLEQVLGAHPQITSGGELAYFARCCASGTLAPYPAALATLDHGVLQEVAEGYIAYLEERFPGAARVTDKRPDNILYLGVIKALFPRAKIIHATRHALDNALSVYFQNLDEKFNYATELTHILHFNSQLRRLMDHWSTLFGDDILPIHYDEFVTDQHAQTRRLLDFCGLPWHEDCLAFHARDSTVRTASLWQVRKPLYQRSSGRWLNYREHVEHLAGEIHSPSPTAARTGAGERN